MIFSDNNFLLLACPSPFKLENLHDPENPENLHDLQNDLLFLSEKMEVEKIVKLVANLNDKTRYAIHIKSLKQALNHGLVFRKVH